MSERTTIEVTLPSGTRVVLYDRLVNFENRAIQKLLLTGRKIELSEPTNAKPQTPALTWIDAGMTVDMEDLAVKFLVKEAYQDGQKVADIKQFVDYLSDTDAKVLYAKVQEVVSASQLSDTDKKK